MTVYLPAGSATVQNEAMDVVKALDHPSSLLAVAGRAHPSYCASRSQKFKQMIASRKSDKH